MLCGSLEGQREPLDTRVPSSLFHGWLCCAEHGWGRALGAEGWAVAVLLSRRAAVGKSPSCRLRSAGAVSASVREQGTSSARGHPALPAPPAAAAGGFVWGHSRGVCAGQFAGGRAALAVSRPHEAPLELPVRVRGALRRCGLPPRAPREPVGSGCAGSRWREGWSACPCCQSVRPSVGPCTVPSAVPSSAGSSGRCPRAGRALSPAGPRFCTRVPRSSALYKAVLTSAAPPPPSDRGAGLPGGAAVRC